MKTEKRNENEEYLPGADLSVSFEGVPAKEVGGLLADFIRKFIQDVPDVASPTTGKNLRTEMAQRMIICCLAASTPDLKDAMEALADVAEEYEKGWKLVALGAANYN